MIAAAFLTCFILVCAARFMNDLDTTADDSAYSVSADQGMFMKSLHIRESTENTLQLEANERTTQASLKGYVQCTGEDCCMGSRLGTTAECGYCGRRTQARGWGADHDPCFGLPQNNCTKRTNDCKWEATETRQAAKCDSDGDLTIEECQAYAGNKSIEEKMLGTAVPHGCVVKVETENVAFNSVMFNKIKDDEYRVICKKKSGVRPGVSKARVKDVTQVSNLAKRGVGPDNSCADYTQAREYCKAEWSAMHCSIDRCMSMEGATKETCNHLVPFFRRACRSTCSSCCEQHSVADCNNHTGCMVKKFTSGQKCVTPGHCERKLPHPAPDKCPAASTKAECTAVASGKTCQWFSTCEDIDVSEVSVSKRSEVCNAHLCVVASPANGHCAREMLDDPNDARRTGIPADEFKEIWPITWSLQLRRARGIADVETMCADIPLASFELTQFEKYDVCREVVGCVYNSTDCVKKRHCTGNPLSAEKYDEFQGGADAYCWSYCEPKEKQGRKCGARPYVVAEDECARKCHHMECHDYNKEQYGGRRFMKGRCTAQVGCTWLQEQAECVDKSAYDYCTALQDSGCEDNCTLEGTPSRCVPLGFCRCSGNLPPEEPEKLSKAKCDERMANKTSDAFERCSWTLQTPEQLPKVT